ncbi:hypothetical protein EDD16DRAFT_1707369 [Pisolithus croceorrhizus]|nr:hypothetical protein EDD16DRAFT_1707369 [Pisolithus croceorrhizus]KAI6154512.1 hypothetical protein EDD17DRAFT_1764781 [Pisolithus thermaeus]
MSHPSTKTICHRMNAMAITNVISGSELDKSTPSPPPLSQYMHPQWGHSSSDAWKALRDDDNYVEPSGDKIDNDGILAKWGTKWDPHNTNTSTAPPSKQTKIQHVSSSQGSQHSGSGVNKKCINSDLPLGAMNETMPGNVSSYLLSPTLLLAMTTHGLFLMTSSSTYYRKYGILCTGTKSCICMVVIGGPVYSLISVVYIQSLTLPFSWQQTKQGLSNWHAGFAAAAIAVITTFFAHDVDFEDLTPHMKFADAMLKKNWFLFSQNRGTDNKMWTGLWQALFILQTFTHHFNFIQGHADISALSNDFSGPHTALMLTSAAIFIFLIISLRCMVLILLCHFSQVCQTLSLVTEGHMSFKMTQLGNVWTATILKGGQFKFGKAVWDTMTRHYLEPIKELSDEQCGLIVEDTQKFMKKVTAPMASTLESVGEDELNDLFTFQ